MIWNQLRDFMILLLIAVAVVCAALDDFKAFAVLLIVVVLNTVIGFVQEYKAEQALDALERLEVPRVRIKKT